MIVLLFLLALMFLCIGVVSYVIGPAQRGPSARRLWQDWIVVYIDLAILLTTLGVVAAAVTWGASWR